jgi:hypothetical protein
VTLAFLAFVLLAPLVAANGAPRWTFDTWLHGLLGIGIANFSINLLFISSVLHLTVRIKGMAVGAFSPVQWGFLGQILGSNLIITTCGAVIDFWVFYQKAHVGYDFFFSPFRFAIGILMVSASVVITCMLLLRLKPRFSLTIAAAMGAFNLISWVVAILLAFEMTLLFMVIIVAVSSTLFTIPMSLLMRWHSKVFEATDFGEPRILRCNLLCMSAVLLTIAAWPMGLDHHSGDWLFVIMAATLGLVSPLAGGVPMLYMVISSNRPEIEGTGVVVLALCTLIMLASFAYPLGKGYERKRCVLDRVFTFRSAPVSTRFQNPTKNLVEGFTD